MKNKFILFIALMAFTSISHSAINYEVKDIQRVTDMFGTAVCINLNIVNDTRTDHQFNLFMIEARGDGLSTTPSIFVSKKPEFNVNGSLPARGRARGWLCLDEPEYGWEPEEIAFSTWSGTFLTIKVK